MYIKPSIGQTQHQFCNSAFYPLSLVSSYHIPMFSMYFSLFAFCNSILAASSSIILFQSMVIYESSHLLSHSHAFYVFLIICVLKFHTCFEFLISSCFSLWSYMKIVLCFHNPMHSMSFALFVFCNSILAWSFYYLCLMVRSLVIYESSHLLSHSHAFYVFLIICVDSFVL